MEKLTNGDFEGDFRNVGDIGEVSVAEGWEPWWHTDDTRPEYKRATVEVDARRIHGGNAAQQWFNNLATHTAGIYQRVEDIQPGAKLTFSAWVQAFSSSKDDFSHSQGRYRMRIGIDSYGSVDPESPDIVWSDGGDSVQPYDAYVKLAVQTTAKSDRCTVFIWGQAEWAIKHNNGYVDDCVLTVEGGGGGGGGGGLTESDVLRVCREEMERRVWAVVPMS